MAAIDMPFKMRNLTTFRIERVCFDLGLKILEQLDANDVIELVKVNQEFQEIIVNRPSIVFGPYVDTIEFGDIQKEDSFIGDQDEEENEEEDETIFIQKSNPDSRKIKLNVIRHFPLIKNIRSCRYLGIESDHRLNSNFAIFLKQLKAVNELCMSFCPPQNQELFFHFPFKIKEFARLSSFVQEAPSLKDRVEHLIETQLNECEKVEFHCNVNDDFHFYYGASKKIYIKHIEFICYENLIAAEAIRWFVSYGIPSKNPAAYGSLCAFGSEDMEGTIVDYLSGYPGMKQISEGNPHFIALAEDRLGYSFCGKPFCFRRNIDAARDCIYMWNQNAFYVFYVKPDEMIDP